jgi:NAD(P)-dependent dehydrogenase (short-subunit alcohol dehydrogenase family)
VATTVNELAVPPNVLVVGAAEKSLGAAIAQELVESEWDFGDVAMAGISGEPFVLDVLRTMRIAEVLAELRPDIVVCTVGLNMPVGVDDQYLGAKMATSFSTNVTGPMEMLRHFIKSPIRPEREGHVKKFVAISSNSARIARRGSVAYCASKAALSMALRVAGRELAPSGKVMVWGYEPGLLDGTPMTQETAEAFPTMANLGQLHRMPGVPPEGLPPQDLARRIVQDLATFSYAHNGMLFPFDAGEQ